MKLLFIILIIFFITSCANEEEIVLSTHDNGQIHEVLILNKPILEDSIGIKRIFFENGELQCEGGYKNGVRHGNWICYFRNGQVKWMCTYNNGIENGEILCKFEDGTWRTLRMVNGKRNGLTAEYNFDSTNNQFYYIYGQYKNNLETGLWTWEDTIGCKIKVWNYDNGINTGYVAFYYPNGKIKMKGMGYIKSGEDYNRFKDTLFFYNEFEDGKVDSFEIYKEGIKQKTIYFTKNY